MMLDYVHFLSKVLLVLARLSLNSSDNAIPNDLIAVQLSTSNTSIAKELALEYGYQYVREIGTLDGYYLFRRSKDRRTKRHSSKSILSSSNVLWMESQLPRKRVKREAANARWSDPMYGAQWHLYQRKPTAPTMYIEEAWEMGYTGSNVVVSILDDGVQWDHPDLRLNYASAASYDINDGDADPMPRDDGTNRHGTRSAGSVAAQAGNKVCGVGVAYNASIGGIRMLDGEITDSVEGESLSHRIDYIDIYVSSWGPDDDGKTIDGPGKLGRYAFKRGSEKGRNGLGSIFVWAAGNGGRYYDSCSCDGYSTSIYTVSINSVTYENRRPWYTEECPSVIASTYSSGHILDPNIVTTDFPNSCTISATGTSASAPIAAGIIALALQAKQNLTWRDVQHLLVRSSFASHLLKEEGWHLNGVGRYVSEVFGYGLMNAKSLVQMAKKWTTVPYQLTCLKADYNDPKYPIHIEDRLNMTSTISIDSSSCQINYLEHVVVSIDLKYQERGAIAMKLISPSGTKTTLLKPRPRDFSSGKFGKWPMMSIQNWEENPRGTWTLILTGERSGTPLKGLLRGWELTLYGTLYHPQPSELIYTPTPSTSQLHSIPYPKQHN